MPFFFLSARSRFPQPEVTFTPVKRHYYFQTTVIGDRRLNSGSPVRQGKVGSGFESELGELERPGNGGAGIATRNVQTVVCGDARVQKHRDRGNPSCQIHPAKVRYREVGFAVAVEVARSDRQGKVSRRVGDSDLEGAVAVAQKHRDVVEPIVGQRQIQFAVSGLDQNRTNC